ncbi:MAG: hypothetical protein KF687_10710 [Cyclobacteriaceae bacterium]|nr:hypothetical protein [Cyclobacteriaceae bacterium]
MKQKFLILSTLLIALVATLFLQSCNDDEDAAAIVLVVAERSTGKIFKVDPTNGSKTEVGTITAPAGGGLTNIRGMIYHQATNKIYASTTTGGDGAIYSIDPATKQATVLNADPDDDWYGVADLLMTSDNKIIGSLWFREGSTTDYGPGLLTLNTNGTISKEVIFSDDDICCGMGMIFGNSNNEILIGSYYLTIYKSNLSGVATIEAELSPEGFSSTDPGDFYLQNMVKDASGTIYAVVFSDDDNTYLAKVDLTANKVIKIGVLGEGSSNRFHGLMLLSSDLL